MKLLPGPGKPETKNTTAHSDQRLFNKESRQDNPTPQFRYPQGRVGPAETWKHRSEGPRPDFPVKQGGWHLSGAPGTFRGHPALLARATARLALTAPERTFTSFQPLLPQVYWGGHGGQIKFTHHGGHFQFTEVRGSSAFCLGDVRRGGRNDFSPSGLTLRVKAGTQQH